MTRVASLFLRPRTAVVYGLELHSRSLDQELVKTPLREPSCTPVEMTDVTAEMRSVIPYGGRGEGPLQELATRTCRSRSQRDAGRNRRDSAVKVKLKLFCSNTGGATVLRSEATRSHAFRIISSDDAHTPSRVFGMLDMDSTHPLPTSPPPQKQEVTQAFLVPRPSGERKQVSDVPPASVASAKVC